MNKVYLKEHLKRYPLMQLEDILKLHFQGVLGPGHLISDKELVNKRLLKEYEECKDLTFKYSLIEEISDEYVRVYLKPYYEEYKTFISLVEAFYKSANEVKSKEEFIKVLQDLNQELKDERIDLYLQRDNYLISHSETYRNNYHPHYLVISKKYIDICLNKK